jgi:hypothetical protein
MNLTSLLLVDLMEKIRKGIADTTPAPVGDRGGVSNSKYENYKLANRLYADLDSYLSLI